MKMRLVFLSHLPGAESDSRFSGSDNPTLERVLAL